MTDSPLRNATSSLWILAVAVLVGTAAASLMAQAPGGQAQPGASARPPARQNAPLIVLSPKAKSAGWTGVHKPHTKLGDVLARHKGQVDWAETIVDDESLFAQWISIAPGRRSAPPKGRGAARPPAARQARSPPATR